MNRKYIITIVTLTLFCISAGWYFYPHYQKYLPTTSQVIFPVSLSEDEIENIRLNQPITHIQVFKAHRIIFLMHHNKKLRTYPMRLGFNPVGHKQQEGDGKTPEGQYEIDWRNPNSAFYKSLHISYPNQHDTSQAQHLGVSAGGNVMIHGSNKKFLSNLPFMMAYFPREDWTLGCIAVRNIDMDEIWQLVDNNTKITIYP